MTLIAVYNSEGCVGRCDAKCYDAQEPGCHCVCGGMNHGKGQGNACDNTHRMAEELIKKHNADHPDLQIQIPEDIKRQELLFRT